MQRELLDDLARQAALVYSGEVPDVTVEMTGKCGFCQFRGHCAASLSADNLALLERAESRMAHGSMAGKATHKNLRQFLDGFADEQAKEAA
ncbi:hypothetical protein D3C74_451570 [compost metagenome]